MKPICIPCKKFYRCKQAGYYFVEGFPIGNLSTEESDVPLEWAPYKLWAGDLLECPGCGSQIISGCGEKPLSEHWQQGFRQTVKSFNPQLQVNDC